MSDGRQPAFALILLLVVASLSTFLLHGQTLSYGFDYDDYHFTRPYSRAEVIAAFHGPWDAAGIERPYYRPLTIAFYAARFELLGINATAHHCLSLALFSLAATLAGWFALRLTASVTIGLVTTVFYVVHPAMPYSLVAWVTNQMHLLESIVLLSALIWWHVVRLRSATWWLPLLALAIVAFLIKEDGIMLLPVILVLHAIGRRIVHEQLPPVSRAFLAATVVTLLVLIGARQSALSATGSLNVPATSVALTNYLHGLNGLLRLVPADRPWQLAASWFVTLAPLTAFILWRRLSREAHGLVVSGLAIALLFNLPFVLITKAEQMHLVALGVVLLLAGACGGLLLTTRERIVRSGVALTCAAGVACLAAVARDITRDFEPYGAVVLAHDEMVRGWAAVPIDLRAYLERKRSPGASRTLSPDPSLALDFVMFGTHGPERSPDGVSYRWMSASQVQILIREGTRKVTIPLRHAIEVFREPARVRIATDGRIVDEITLATSEWRLSTTAIPSAHPPGLGRMHRLTITMDHAWRPMEIIPGSRDDRTLGLQIGEVQLR
jgi:hypothetical protein